MHDHHIDSAAFKGLIVGGLIPAGVDSFVKVICFTVKPQDPTEGAFFWLDFMAVVQGVYT